jgi:serine/threonine-protein kinase
VLLLLAGTALAGWYVVSQLQDELSGPQVVAVPNVVGLREAQASAQLEAKGFEVEIREAADMDVQTGFVIDQDPRAGRQVPEGDTVTILVSIGKPRAEVPSVVGEPYSSAVQILRDAGFDVDRAEEFSGDVDEGRVIRQDPAAGVRAVEGSAVTVVVSLGLEMGIVPSVVGLDSASAKAAIKDAGFKFDVVKAPSDSDKGAVIEQNPVGGTEAVKGSTVEITVSSGPETVAVPDVLDQDRQSATDELEAVGFQIEVIEQDTNDPTKDDVVVDQSPRPNEEVEEGSTVTITVGRFVAPAGDG